LKVQNSRNITCSGGSCEQCCQACNRKCLKSHFSKVLPQRQQLTGSDKSDHSDYIGDISHEDSFHNGSFGGFNPANTQHGIFYQRGSLIRMETRPTASVSREIYQKMRSGQGSAFWGSRRLNPTFTLF